MPLKDGTAIGEAREVLSAFLRETGCYDICAECPVYPGGEGCCHGCGKLVSGAGCEQPNLSCLTYTCSVLNQHLIEQGKFEEFTDLSYGLPREGYRGCTPRPPGELIQISDPLREVKASIDLKKVYSLRSQGEGE